MNNQKSVLRLTIAMFLFVGLVGIWMSGCENRIQEQKVERLIRQLQDRDPNVRGNAAITLGNMGVGTKDAVPALIQVLQNQDTEGFVRSNAAITLGQIGSEDEVYVLMQTLQHDQDAEVRKGAILALGSIGSEDVVPTLIQALNDQSVSVRGNAAKVLDSISTIYPEALEAVKEYRFRQ